MSVLETEAVGLTEKQQSLLDAQREYHEAFLRDLRTPGEMKLVLPKRLIEEAITTSSVVEARARQTDTESGVGAMAVAGTQAE